LTHPEAASEEPSLPLAIDLRLRLLAGVPGFSRLPAPALGTLARLLQEATFQIGAVVVREGEIGDRLYLIATGRAEISVRGLREEIPLAGVGEGELVGEIALLEPGGRHLSSVTALTSLRCLALSDPDFDRLLDAHPDARAVFTQAAQEMREITFLKRASPFAQLSSDRLRWLATRLEPASFEADAEIAATGAAGETCYLITSGRVEVWGNAEPDAPRRLLATLGTGAILGESSLLAGSPSPTTARAISPVGVLALRRSDLLEAMGAERLIASVMIEVVRLRARPRRADGVVASHLITAAGEAVTILKNPARHTYYRLSPEGWFIWQRLDGAHGLRDLTLDCVVEFKAFAPQSVAGVLAGLAMAGFSTTPSLRADVRDLASRTSVWQRLVHRASQIIEWQLAVPNINDRVTRWHDAGIRLLFTRTSQVVLAGIALSGVAAFAAVSLHVARLDAKAPTLLLFLVPAYLLSILAHEAGHAFTTKTFGYEVPRAGVGWYWFGPIAFVDTSDMWLAARWPRIAVSLAGPYTNLVLGGLASLLAFGTSNAVATAALWQFSVISYLIVLTNLNPLLEYDGYYVLMDWLERPNLRQHALAWLGQQLPRALRTRGGLRGHRLELAYGLASLAYVASVGALTVVSYRLFALTWIARVLSDGAASALAWVMAGLVVTLSLTTVIGQLRSASLQPNW
jgi:putative peptide zinc metalloprotease protein